MKNILLMLFLAMPMLGLAESDTTKFKAKEQYCLLIATEKTFSSKFNVKVDFGDKEQFLTKEDQALKAKVEAGGRFDSPVDALNQMAKQGWTLVNAYRLADGATPQGNILHYVLRRKLTD